MADYLKSFATQADYDAYIASDYPKPNVSYIEATDETIFTNYEDGPAGADSTLVGIAPEDWPSTLTTVTGNASSASNETVKYLVKEFYIPEGVTTFDTGAFQGYENLEKINAPSSLTTINTNAFQGTAKLKLLNLTDLAAWCDVDILHPNGHPFNYKHDCHLLLNGAELTDLTIPSGITAIKQYTFFFCENLTSLNIPSSVTSIGNQAFYNCSKLTSVNIPSTVTSIGSYAFFSCSALASVTVRATTPPALGGSAFNSTSANMVIYVPAESVEAYKAASGWSTYASKIQAIPA